MQSETTAGMEAGNVHSCSNCDRPLDPPQAESAENVSPNIESGTVDITEKPATRAKLREGLSPKSQAIPEAPTTSPFSTGARKRTGKINNPPPSSTGSFSQHFETTIRLNEILSGETELDHPICRDCSDTLIDSVDERLKEVEIEVEDYQRYLADLSDRDEEGEESIEELRAELARLEANEEKLISHCRALERERDNVFRKRDQMLVKEKLLLEDEKKETKEYLGIKYHWIKANEEFLSVGNRYKYAEHRLRTLNGTNAFKEMFQIDCDGSIGKINGFRLGKLTAVPVKWKEINIAWGETVFLMDFLCRMFDFESEEFVPVPYGDKSHVELIRKKSVTWPLYLHAEGDSEKMPMYDSAQMAFLKCLSQLEQAIKRRYKDFALIHPISNCKIQGNDSERPHSITLSINTHEGWTKALKCMLVDLRQILTFYIDRVKGGK